jgi:hypothetical protein
LPSHIVRGAKFENDLVELDDKDFRGPCSFTNVTFVYNGGPWNFENCAVIGKVTVRTDNRIIKSAQLLFETLHMMREGVHGGEYDPDHGQK